MSLHRGRLLALAMPLVLAGTGASVWTVRHEVDQAATLHAVRTLAHVESRMHGVVAEMRLLADNEHAWGFDACPDGLSRALTNASVESLAVRRFALLVLGESMACMPGGLAPTPYVTLSTDDLPHLVGTVAGGADRWITLALPAKFPGAHLVAQLDPRLFAGWSARVAGTPDLLPQHAWSARLLDVDGADLGMVGGNMALAADDPGWTQAQWSEGFATGVSVHADAREVTRAALQRAAGVVVLLLLGVAAWTAAVWRRALRRARLSQRILRALQRGEFVPFVQPVVDLASGRCVGAEMLMRWQHPQRGLLAPIEFIEEAERTGFIVPMSEQVMAEAARRLAPLLRLRPELYFSFNITPQQLRRPEFAARLAEIFHAGTLPREQVLLELTEREFVDGQTSAALEALHAAGWRLAVDDFGTGHSSLAALEQLTIDRIKIDRAFVRTIDDATSSRPVLDAIISLAGQLGVPLIAEGVETRSQWDYLAARGVQHAQGYLMARPMAIDDFQGWLQGGAEAGGQVTASPGPGQGASAASAGQQLAEGAGMPDEMPAGDELLHLMAGPDGLPLRDHGRGLLLFHGCVTGREVIDWLMAHHAPSRSTAQRWAAQLMRRGRLRHVFDDRPMRDDRSLYRLG